MKTIIFLFFICFMQISFAKANSIHIVNPNPNAIATSVQYSLEGNRIKPIEIPKNKKINVCVGFGFGAVGFGANQNFLESDYDVDNIYMFLKEKVYQYLKKSPFVNRLQTVHFGEVRKKLMNSSRWPKESHYNFDSLEFSHLKKSDANSNCYLNLYHLYRLRMPASKKGGKEFHERFLIVSQFANFDSHITYNYILADIDSAKPSFRHFTREQLFSPLFFNSLIVSNLHVNFENMFSGFKPKMTKKKNPLKLMLGTWRPQKNNKKNRKKEGWQKAADDDYLLTISPKQIVVRSKGVKKKFNNYEVLVNGNDEFIIFMQNAAMWQFVLQDKKTMMMRLISNKSFVSQKLEKL